MAVDDFRRAWDWKGGNSNYKIPMHVYPKTEID